jgi:hypothetical protein
MLVSHKYKFIFIKTVKTGSTSTEIYLEQYCLPPHLLQEEHHCECRVTEEGIVGSRSSKKLQEYYHHMKPFKIRAKVGADIFDYYQKIANIRNPFDLMVSHYFFEPTYTKFAGNKKYTFHQYIMKTDVVSSLSEKTRDFFYLDDVFIVDHILRQETLSADLEKLTVDLGLPPSVRVLSNYKESTERIGKHYSEYYKPLSKALVQDHFGWYLDLFGYSF